MVEPQKDNPCYPPIETEISTIIEPEPRNVPNENTNVEMHNEQKELLVYSSKKKVQESQERDR